ncbi:MAG: AAA family ATPase [Prolixibacteraceae bacterium]|nr:AAA family ATPase [Prolixibacteraceae bacterium]
MSKIKIKNFGPISEGFQTNDGWIEIDKVTVFIGNQGSGKSTVAKLFSTLSWLEKSINRGDINKDKISFATFIGFTKYHNIHNYFKDNTFIDFIGEKYRITYDRVKKFPTITPTDNKNYNVPKIMYVPSERNFLSTISDAYNIKGLPDNLFTFAEELKKTQKALKGKEINLQIGSYKYKYDEDDDNSYVIGDNYKINLLEASSGLQSFTPMFLVSRELSSAISGKEETLRKNMSVTQSIRMDNEITELMLNKSIPDSTKTKKIDDVKNKYINKCFINIVEEPEQNLFPNSQWEMLKSLLKFNEKSKNKLLITTHSPYIVNYLSVIIKAGQLRQKVKSNVLIKRIENIVPSSSLIPNNIVRVYEFNENLGEINIIENYKGLPSDENSLNLGLADSNDLFSNLLDIEDSCL